MSDTDKYTDQVMQILKYSGSSQTIVEIVLQFVDEEKLPLLVNALEADTVNWT